MYELQSADRLNQHVVSYTADSRWPKRRVIVNATLDDKSNAVKFGNVVREPVAR
jgi:hypothetical protein